MAPLAVVTIGAMAVCVCVCVCVCVFMHTCVSHCDPLTVSDSCRGSSQVCFEFHILCVLDFSVSDSNHSVGCTSSTSHVAEGSLCKIMSFISDNSRLCDHCACIAIKWPMKTNTYQKRPKVTKTKLAQFHTCSRM